MIVEYHEAAFEHKVSESDIEWALITLTEAFSLLALIVSAIRLRLRSVNWTMGRFLYFTLCRAAKNG
jgi:hypothetical protein